MVYGKLVFGANLTLALILYLNPKPNPNTYSNPCPNLNPNSDANPNLNLNELTASPMHDDEVNRPKSVRSER